MSKQTRNTGTIWSDEDVELLKKLTEQNKPTRAMSFILGRSPSAIRSKAQKIGLSLRGNRRFTNKKK